MANEPVIGREEMVGALFTLNDLNRNVERIRELLEEDLGGEEESEENES